MELPIYPTIAPTDDLYTPTPSAGIAYGQGARLVGHWHWIEPLEMAEPTPAARVGEASAIASLMAEPVIKALSSRERAQLPLRGLEGFMAFLRARIDRADDITDFGFTHMQVDLHRIRQMMMTTSDAARLSTSPALAAIAKSDSAVNVQAQIKEFIGRIKQPALVKQQAPASTGEGRYRGHGGSRRVSCLPLRSRVRNGCATSN